MIAWISGYVGHHNVGDEAILASVLQHLPIDTNPVFFSSNPVHTQLVGVKSLLLPFRPEKLSSVPKKLCDRRFLPSGRVHE